MSKVPNGITTGGSITSGLCSLCVLECCKTLNSRLAPVRKMLQMEAGTPPVDWQMLIGKAYGLGINLQANNWVDLPAPPDQSPFTYNSYGVAMSLVQVWLLILHSVKSNIVPCLSLSVVSD